MAQQVSLPFLGFDDKSPSCDRRSQSRFRNGVCSSSKGSSMGKSDCGALTALNDACSFFKAGLSSKVQPRPQAGRGREKGDGQDPKHHFFREKSFPIVIRHPSIRVSVHLTLKKQSEGWKRKRGRVKADRVIFSQGCSSNSVARAAPAALWSGHFFDPVRHSDRPLEFRNGLNCPQIPSGEEFRSVCLLINIIIIIIDVGGHDHDRGRGGCGTAERNCLMS